tara:strand:+ start:1189 stop:1335 length:147 start_codon:yes stop_codon:yes gene_type:complete
MEKKIDIIPDTWEDLELLDADATNEELLERINALTEYINFLYKGQTGI